MSMGKKLRHFWHDLYYALASEGGVKFAMKCQDAAEIIDLGQEPSTFVGRMRFRLHMSLCQACRNYRDATKALRKAVRELAEKNSQGLHLDRLNQDLLRKFSRKD